MAEFGLVVVPAVIGDPRGGVCQQNATGATTIAEAQQPLRQGVADLVDGQALGRLRRGLFTGLAGLAGTHPSR